MRAILLVPLLLIGCSSAGSLPDSLQSRVMEMLDACPGTWGLYYRDLGTGETLSVNATRVFHAASTMKVLVLVKLIQDVEEGLYSLEDEVRVEDTFPSAVQGEKPFKTTGTEAVRKAVGKMMPIGDLARCMITHSDNLATNVLIRLAGGAKAVTETARKLGLVKSNVARYIMDIAAFRRGIFSRAQPIEYCNLLERLWRGEIAGSERILEILSACGADWIGSRLPPGTQIAHKEGAISETRHDVGIVWLNPDRAFLLAVFSCDLRDEKKGEETISNLARLFYDHVGKP